jgi:hypothetical protein
VEIKADQKLLPDWRGVGPRREPLAPLTPSTFVARLDALTDAVASLRAMRSTLRVPAKPNRPDELSHVPDAPRRG